LFAIISCVLFIPSWLILQQLLENFNYFLFVSLLADLGFYLRKGTHFLPNIKALTWAFWKLKNCLYICHYNKIALQKR